MVTNIIDLREYRCPMTLLLAKRQCLQFFSPPYQYAQQLTFLVAERNSMQDITHYLTKQNYAVTTTSTDDGFKLVVIANKESNLYV